MEQAEPRLSFDRRESQNPGRTAIVTGGASGIGRALAEALAARVERLGAMEPAVLARRTLRAVARNRAIIVEPWTARLSWYLDRFSPWLSEKLWHGALLLARRLNG